MGAPFLTCEGAVIEAAHFCAPSLIARILEDGDFVLAFNLAEQIGAVRLILEKYRDQEIDFTDACIVRMSELYPNCQVFTVDRRFQVFKRFKTEQIPITLPPTAA